VRGYVNRIIGYWDISMIRKTTDSLADLYEADETAWLEAMAELIRDGRANGLDYPI
jgi:hypothetical protein